MDDKTGLIILGIVGAILGIIKMILEILKNVLEILEKLKAHPKRQPVKHKRRG
ncbi:hypothetical protein Ga0466249_002273 [Sporomusaceae bacterium BoRhaA]|uniref:hypothetical protein n=1 Tax=Pelorhabdus rhamnosifermentans TaxID=2772457 RepID=UPI001C0641CD|nr:hypothetical protein [Pelorhabdus rhamnosifermentans]MBU2701159.1 hypothetical protein [Pelorhabdus rhamnosifermentans]